MYYLTGLPGWMRFGYSPGWAGRSPTGLPPMAQHLMQTGQLPQAAPYAAQVPPSESAMPAAAQSWDAITGAGGARGATMPMPQIPKEQEIQMLKYQAEMLEQQLEQIKKRLEEIERR